MGATLSSWFSICGLGLDFVGAAFLAYDVLHWGKHPQRAQANAFVGLLLLMAGFACQATGIVLSGRLLS